MIVKCVVRSRSTWEEETYQDKAMSENSGRDGDSKNTTRPFCCCNVQSQVTGSFAEWTRYLWDKKVVLRGGSLGV